MARSVEVLPTPLRPSSATVSPGPTLRFTPCRTGTLPMSAVTPSTVSMMLRSLVFGRAQVGFLDLGVGADLLGRTAREERTLCHNDDLVGDGEHHLHVVLDENHIDALG